ncbi:MAG: hypothetical protein DWQ37_05315 [Planctomycetota bacterium]|nr:MAG: hypothetical protein DWQ37_05315 [Planctomycetota bacterium]
MPRLSLLKIWILSSGAALAAAWGIPAGIADEPFTLTTADGYHGIWYSVGKTDDQYAYKYSGGMPTYPAKHLPIAIHAPQANKTFFVYGGSPPGERQLLHMISYFDHATGTVPRPRILLDKKTRDAHDNPTLTIDQAGHLWVFSNSHGTSRPSFIHRSVEPYSIDRFERVVKTNFSYGQPWTLDDGSFLFMHTRYKSGKRQTFWMTSADGRQWSEPQPLARMARGHYQVSRVEGNRVGTMLNYHPPQGGLDARTNLYYLESSDAGRTWRAADGTPVETPLESPDTAALVHDYESEGKLVYLKQLQFDSEGHPVLLYCTSNGYRPGPENDPRTWQIARWTGQSWAFNDVVTSDHNYDFGSLYLEDDGTWRLIAPTSPGAQPYCTGGQMEMWVSSDQGRTWGKTKSLTHDDKRNHSFARQPLDAHEDFYALWGDGNAHEPSASSLYFTDRGGTHVWRLPTQMAGETAEPEIAW